jgi:hypothetical protein
MWEMREMWEMGEMWEWKKSENVENECHFHIFTPACRQAGFHISTLVYVAYTRTERKGLPELRNHCSGSLLPALRTGKRSSERNILAHGYPFLL